MSAEIPLSVEQVLVAGNRGHCGGVNMGVQATDQVLSIVDGREPVYTNWDIVNNRPTMERFERRGLINIKNNFDLVPDGSIMEWSAHGVPLKARQIANQKGLLIIDTTCQLVTRVHTLVKKAETKGMHVVYIGKSGHPETIGVMGEVDPHNITLVETTTPIEEVDIPEGKEVIVYSQTTLATDEIREQQANLRNNFPSIIIPPRWDICGATDTRQTAAEDLLDNHGIDFLLVAGSSHSHNSQELKRKAEKRGIPSALVDRAEDVDLDLFKKGVKVVGATSGASEDENDFQLILDIFRRNGINPVVYIPQVIPESDITFKLPQKDIDALKQRYA